MALVQAVEREVGKRVVGQEYMVERLLISLLTGGHVLLEGVPGLAKTLTVRTLAETIHTTFQRIQFTPDLLPADVLGTQVFDQSTGSFTIKRGPIFANIVLADEINRTPPRTQTALLEAMSEGTVTIDGRTHALDKPFMLLATQNPFDFEGTYPLPENQLDRFFMRIGLGYPAPEDEARVLAQRPAEHALQELRPVLSAGDVRRLQEQVDRVRVEQALLDYIVAIAGATRRHPDLLVGLSPRGALALAQAARATAVLHGRDYAIPEDVVDSVLPVCAHRIAPRAYTPVHSAAMRDESDYPPGSPQGILLSILGTIPSPA